MHAEAAILYDGCKNSHELLHDKGAILYDSCPNSEKRPKDSDATLYNGSTASQHVMSKDDDSKILFITDNWESAIPDSSEASALPETLAAAIDWVASTAPDTIKAEREATINSITVRAQKLQKGGAVKDGQCCHSI